MAGFLYVLCRYSKTQLDGDRHADSRWLRGMNSGEWIDEEDHAHTGLPHPHIPPWDEVQQLLSGRRCSRPLQALSIVWWAHSQTAAVPLIGVTVSDSLCSLCLAPTPTPTNFQTQRPSHQPHAHCSTDDTASLQGTCSISVASALGGPSHWPPFSATSPLPLYIICFLTEQSETSRNVSLDSRPLVLPQPFCHRARTSLLPHCLNHVQVHMCCFWNVMR